MINIRYYTNIAPHYRKNLWEIFLSDTDLDFTIFFGKSSKKNGIKEIDFTESLFRVKSNKLRRLKNFYFRHILIYQKGTVIDSIKNRPQVGIFLGQPYIISNWIATIIYKMKGVKIILWGHGLYGKESYFKKLFNLFFLKIADIYISYNNYGKQILIDNGIDKDKIYVINNSLNYSKCIELRERNKNLSKTDILHFFDFPEKYLLIFVGRLTPQKRIKLLIEAVLNLNNNKINYNLLIIGDGSEKDNLIKYALKGIKSRYIKFLGSLYDEAEISKYLSVADLCISPGNVGLTAIHAMSYGTPVCTHNNFKNQMPEFEAIEDMKTGIFFKENDLGDLEYKIKSWFDGPYALEDIRTACKKKIDEKYNPNFQMNVLKSIINKLSK